MWGTPTAWAAGTKVRLRQFPQVAWGQGRPVVVREDQHSAIDRAARTSVAALSVLLARGATIVEVPVSRDVRPPKRSTISRRNLIKEARVTQPAIQQVDVRAQREGGVMVSKPVLDLLEVFPSCEQ